VNGVDVHVYGQNNVVESFFVGDLWFVVFENGKCAIQSLVGGKSLVVDGSELEFVKW
jgi:hypothetical protein